MSTTSHQRSTSQTWTSRRVGGAALTTVLLVLGALLFGTVWSVIGIMALSVTIGSVVRTLLVLGVLTLALVAGYRWSLGGPRVLWIASGLIAYLLLPSAWVGKALIATAFGLSGVAAWALDLVVWTVAVVLIVRSRPEVHDNRIDTSGLR